MGRTRRSTARATKPLKSGRSGSFESLLGQLSTKFASLPYEKVDTEIETALHLVVEYLGTDRSAIFEFLDDGLHATHAYARPGIPSHAGLRIDQFQWFFRNILSGQPIVYRNLPHDLPEEAVLEREYCKSTGFRALATIPIRVDGSLWGAITTGSFHYVRRFPYHLTERLKLIGEILINAFVRKRAEQRRMEAELEAQRNRDELAHMARISAAGELAASIAHELNQPLTGILSNAQAALRFLSGQEPISSEEFREILTDIIEDNRRAESVIRKLRSLIKKGESEFTRIDINNLIREVCLLIKSDAVIRNVTIYQELTEIPMIRGDQIQLQQVLLNLLLNGLDALEEAPQIRRRILIRSARLNDSTVCVSVRDSGKGIPDEQLAKIFQPFFTTKKEGMGIGLSIVQTILKAHSGRLWAENNPDFGATFYFTLPVVSEQ